MSHPLPGFQIPPLVLDTTDGPLSLAAPLTAPLVLFFYPEDDTEGCTTENREFSALAPAFRKAGIGLCGVSPDSLAVHRRFIAKYRLELTLAADPDHRVIEAFGLWQMKKMFGVEFMGVRRATALVRPDGTLADLVLAPRIKGHAEKVLARASALFGKN